MNLQEYVVTVLSQASKLVLDGYITFELELDERARVISHGGQKVSFTINIMPQSATPERKDP